MDENGKRYRNYFRSGFGNHFNCGRGIWWRWWIILFDDNHIVIVGGLAARVVKDKLQVCLPDHVARGHATTGLGQGHNSLCCIVVPDWMAVQEAHEPLAVGIQLAIVLMVDVQFRFEVPKDANGFGFEDSQWDVTLLLPF